MGACLTFAEIVAVAEKGAMQAEIERMERDPECDEAELTDLRKRYNELVFELSERGL